MRSVIKILSAVSALIYATAVHAQGFPTKPVTLVIPYGAGASNDIFGRFLGDKLSAKWGQPVVVQNMPGAGGAIGMAFAAHAAPDGYTLLWASSTFATNAAAQKNLPFDFENDLQPIAKVGEGELVIVTGSRVPMKSIEDVIREAKAQTVFFGSTGPASTPTFLAKLLCDVTGIEMEGANYKGGSEALVDLIGGRIDLYIGTVTTVLPAIQNHTATPIAVLSKKRSKVLPEVPTIREAGYPGAEAGIWWGIFGPAGMNDDLVGQINSDVASVMGTDEARAMLGKQGAEPDTTSVADFKVLVHDELARWKTLAAKYNIVSE